MSEYLVILHDAEPPTSQGREQLREELVAKLGISESAAADMFESLPVILKENVSREHAEDFLRILESMGANVEILSSSNGTMGTAEETPLLQVTEASESKEEVENSAVTSGDESIEDLGAMLDDMLGDGGEFLGAEELTPSVEEAQAAPVLEQASTPPTEMFVEAQQVEEEPAKEEKEEDGQNIDDLNKLLEQELLGDMEPIDSPTTSAQKVATEESADAGLEAMFNDALASVEEAEKPEAQAPTESAETSVDESKHSAPPPLEVSDASALSLEIEDSGGTEAKTENKSENKKVDKPKEPVIEEVQDSGSGLSFDLDLAEDDTPELEESSLEAALSNTPTLPDDDEEDPFAGLSLPGEDIEEEQATQEATQEAGVDKKAQAATARKERKTKEEEEELANAFANSEIEANDSQPQNEEKVEPQKEEVANLEKSVEVSSEAKPKKKKKKAGSKFTLPGGIQPSHLIFGVIFILLAVVALNPGLLGGKSEEGLKIDQETLQLVINTQEKREAARRKREEELKKKASQAAIQRWTSSGTTPDGHKVTVEILSDGNKILAFEFEFEGAQPPEITDEELIDGIDRPWVHKVTANNLSLAEVVERVTSKSKQPKKILIAESPARAYVSDLKGSSRFAGKVRVELMLDDVTKMSGTWAVSTAVTPEELKDSKFHVKRLGTNSFELAINGELELTPLTLTSKSQKKKKKKKKEESK